MNLPDDREQSAQSTISVASALGFLRRRLWLGIAIAVPVLAGSILLAYKLPAIYISQAKILIEQPAVSDDFVASSTTTYIEERIQVVAQRVLTPDSIGEMIDKYGLYPNERNQMPESELVQKFIADTYLENLTAEVTDTRGRTSETTFAFVLGFRYTDPNRAQQVATDLADQFLQQNVESRKERAATTTAFLEDEAERLAEEITQYEIRIADFKDLYGDALPDQLGSTSDSLRRTETRIATLEQDLSKMRRDRSAIIAELSTMSDGQRLGDLQRQYIELSSRYGSEHPDVKRIKRQLELSGEGQIPVAGADSNAGLAALEAERDALLERYSPDHPDVARIQKQIDALQSSGTAAVAGSTADPAYVQAQARLDSVDEEIGTVERRIRDLTTRRDQLKGSISVGPQVELEWRQLNRGYEALQREFDDIKRRSTSARLTESLEAQNIGERFTLLSRASLPESPIEPNRPAILFLGVVLALGLSIGIAALTDSMDLSVRSAEDLQSTIGARPIGVIPYMHSVAEIRFIWMRRALASAVIVMSILLITVLT